MAAAPPTTDVPDNVRRLALAAALVTVCLWASAFVGIRYAGRELGPGPLALARLLVASAALGAMMLIRRPPMVGRAGLRGVVICGVLWFGAYNVALNAAERRVDAGTASLLVNVAPLFIAILAGRALKEGIGRLLLVGCAVSFSGVALIALGTSRHGLSAGWGAGLCLIAAAVYAVGVVAQKPALRHGSPLAVTWLACAIGAACCLPYAPSLVHQLGHVQASAVAWTVYLGLVPTAIGFSTWAYALARTDAGKLGSTTYLVPPIAVLLGWVMLGEVPPLVALPGGILCLAGVGLARWSPRRRSAGAVEASAAETAAAVPAAPVRS
ncbi:MAG TPA: DMT family transporter [Solirubrobacteraceae bacterium]|jgi:drug/metabolite transporter (DMT)-like permease|nr:DMT family transporter [Solirubrobacteraceae bacterium]